MRQHTRTETLVCNFVRSAGILLVITAVAKLVSASGNVGVLQTPDPLLGLSYRSVFLIAGVVELLIGTSCLFGRNIELNVCLLSSLTAIFALYRVGLAILGHHKLCSCLGNITDALHISPKLAENIMKIIFCYLLFGSYCACFWILKRGRSKNPSTPFVEAAS